jgi:hypothetical protein
VHALCCMRSDMFEACFRLQLGQGGCVQGSLAAHLLQSLCNMHCTCLWPQRQCSDWLATCQPCSHSAQSEKSATLAGMFITALSGAHEHCTVLLHCSRHPFPFSTVFADACVCHRYGGWVCFCCCCCVCVCVVLGSRVSTVIFSTSPASLVPPGFGLC